MRTSEIIDPIDKALVENKIVMDEVCLEEDVCWAALSLMVEQGFYTEDQAQERFLSWREARQAYDIVP